MYTKQSFTKFYCIFFLRRRTECNVSCYPLSKQFIARGHCSNEVIRALVKVHLRKNIQVHKFNANFLLKFSVSEF